MILNKVNISHFCNENFKLYYNKKMSVYVGEIRKVMLNEARNKAFRNSLFIFIVKLQDKVLLI